MTSGLGKSSVAQAVFARGFKKAFFYTLILGLHAFYVLLTLAWTHRKALRIGRVLNIINE